MLARMQVVSVPLLPPPQRSGKVCPSPFLALAGFLTFHNFKRQVWLRQPSRPNWRSPTPPFTVKEKQSVADRVYQHGFLQSARGSFMAQAVHLRN
jgi:hypothetical protein